MDWHGGGVFPMIATVYTIGGVGVAGVGMALALGVSVGGQLATQSVRQSRGIMYLGGITYLA